MICENWAVRTVRSKPTVQNFVRTADPENHLTGFFFKFWRPGQFSERGENNETGANLRTCPQKLEPTVLTKKWEPPNTGFLFSLLFFWWFWSNLTHLWHPQIKLDWHRTFCCSPQQMRFTGLLFVFYCNKCMTGLCQRAWKAMRKWGGGIT